MDSTSSDLLTLFPDYVYLVDELVYFGLGRRSSHRTAFSLANLLFGMLFRLENVESAWADPLVYFVSIFTPTGGLCAQLYALAESVSSKKK